MAKVRWSEESLTHLRSIHDYIAEDSPVAAEAQIVRIRQSVERLGDFPRSGRIIESVGHDDLREVIVGNYRVAYYLKGDVVTIAAVHHGARKIEWKR